MADSNGRCLSVAKYINREELVEWLKGIPLKDLSDGLGLCRVIMEDDFKRAIRTIPDGAIIDVAPIRHGHWSPGYFHDRVCSCCLHPDNDISDYAHSYCPNCGAKMDEVAIDEMSL